MRIIFLAIAALCAVSCNNPDRPSVPPDRAPTLEEVRHAVLSGDLALVPATDFWIAWNGSVEITFGGPDAGLDHLPATLEPIEGMDELDDGCFSRPLESSWTLADDGTLTLETATGGEAASLSLSVRLSVHSERVEAGDERDPYEIVETIRGEGTWEVTPGTACGPDDFSGGRSGRATLEQVQRREAAPETSGPDESLRLVGMSVDGGVALYADRRGRVRAVVSR